MVEELRHLWEILCPVDSGEAKIERTGETIKGTPIPQRMLEVISAGGIDEILRNLKVD